MHETNPILIDQILSAAAEYLSGTAYSHKACALALERARQSWDWEEISLLLDEGDVTIEALILGLAEDAEEIQARLDAEQAAAEEAVPGITASELARALNLRLRAMWHASASSISQYLVSRTQGDNEVTLVRISDHQRADWVRESFPEPMIEVAVGKLWPGAQFSIEPGAPEEKIEALADQIAEALPPQYRRPE